MQNKRANGDTLQPSTEMDIKNPLTQWYSQISASCSARTLGWYGPDDQTLNRPPPTSSLHHDKDFGSLRRAVSLWSFVGLSRGAMYRSERGAVQRELVTVLERTVPDDCLPRAQASAALHTAEHDMMGVDCLGCQ